MSALHGTTMPRDNTTKRIRGRALQERRLRVWSVYPYCAHCARLTAFPDGFQLDHIKALENGGADTDENCQVLCEPCHIIKTARDLGYRERTMTGTDGWPVDTGGEVR
jgi:5-methylcytosine-specific restriction protein A